MTTSPSLHRNLENWSRFASFSHAGMNAFSTAPLASGIHSVDVDGLPIDMMIVPRPGLPMMVTLNGNAPRGPTAAPPFFSGLGVTPKDRLISFVSISDPVLAESETLTLGWYGGSRRIALQQQMPTLMDALITNLRPSRVLFFGGSGGGFASLRAASLMPGSGAIVWNPQTDIRDYEPASVALYAQTCWDPAARDPHAVRGALTRHVQPALTNGFATSGARALYLQNADDWHVDRHMKPFLARNGYHVPDAPFTGRVGPGCYLHHADWGRGHAAPPKYALTNLLRDLLSPEGAFWRDDDAALARIIADAFVPPPEPEDAPPA